MPFEVPFILGPFSVDPDGRISPIRHDVKPGFTVRWQGRTIHTRLMSNDDGRGRLFMQSSLGHIPSTASDPAARTSCIATLKGLANDLPDDWTLRITPDHQPNIAAETAVRFPITVSGLVTELTSFLVELSPYLEVLDQVGVRPASS